MQVCVSFEKCMKMLIENADKTILTNFYKIIEKIYQHSEVYQTTAKADVLERNN